MSFMLLCTCAQLAVAVDGCHACAMLRLQLTTASVCREATGTHGRAISCGKGLL